MADHPVPRRGVDVEAVAATPSYRELIDRLQPRIRESQARAAKALNSQLVMLYWSIGHDILAEQQTGGWGEDIVGRIAEDLRVETGSARGFTRRNLLHAQIAALWSPLVRGESRSEPLVGPSPPGPDRPWAAAAPRLSADELRGRAGASRCRSGAAGDQGPIHIY
jgi:hypothetical protein